MTPNPDNWNPVLPSLQVDGLSPQESGLLDGNGNRLMRQPQIGFLTMPVRRETPKQQPKRFK